MTAFAELDLEARTEQLEKAVQEIRKIGDAGERTEQRVKKSTDAMHAGFGRLKTVVAGAIAAMGTAFASGAIVREISSFETSMSGVGAVTRATTKDLEAMRDVARQLGASTEFSAAQAADGLRFLGMAGFSANEAIAAIPSTLDLATAASLDLASAADIASNVISGFGMGAQEAGRVADVLAAASSRSNTNVAQLGQAMSTVAPISASLGISLEDTAAAIGVLSDAGIQGERAGTALRGIMASLAAPTDQAADALRRYGVNVSEVNPATNSFADIMQRLARANISAGDAMVIFGREAASGALALQSGTQRLAEFGAELLTVEGAAASMAATMRDNLGGDLAGLSSAVSSLILALGDAGLTEAIRAAVQGMTGLVRVISENVQPALNAVSVAVIALAATQIPALVVALSTKAVALAAATTATGLLAGAMSAFGAALTFAGGPLGILLALVAGGAAYLLLFRDNTTEAEKAQLEAAAATAALNAALGTFYQTAAPSAAASAIDLAQKNYDLADSAVAAARAELAKRRAILDARVAQYQDATDPEAALILGAQQDEAIRNVNSQMEALTQAEARLSDAMRARERVARSITGTMSEAMTATRELNSQLSVTLDFPGLGGAGGGAGGGAAAAAPDVSSFEALRQRLQTQREIIEEWRAETIEATNLAHEMERITAQEHAGYMLDIERLYQEQLRELRAQEFDARLSETATFFGAMASLTQQGGDRLAKISKTFAAGEAFINTLRAQAQVLADPKLGFFGKLAAYAKIGAAGLGIVNAIKGGGSSGGGGGGAVGGGGRDPAPAPTAPQGRTIRLNVEGDSMFADALRTNLGVIAEALTEERNIGGFVVG